MILDEDTIRIGHRRFCVTIEPDADSGPPWESGDGYGIVSDWTDRAKAPGERVLATDGRGRKRFYDVSATLGVVQPAAGLAHP